MKIRIFQINGERDQNCAKFRHWEQLEEKGIADAIQPSIYDEVFAGDVDCKTLEEVYIQFNTKGHPLHRGHSLSVSDVVVVDEPPASENKNMPPLQKGAYFCDLIGFRKIDFDPSLAQKPDNLMRVVYVEPHRPAFAAEIPHTLEAEQKAVGGLIEPVYLDENICLICNDEGKLIGMEGNRHLAQGAVIAGPFFICGLSEEDFCSLTDADVEKYTALFAEPEEISQEEVEADTGFTFISI